MDDPVNVTTTTTTNATVQPLPQEPVVVPVTADQSVEFSIAKLKSLDEQLGRPKWVVPVRSKDELEMLIRGAIALARESQPLLVYRVTLSLYIQ